MGDLVLEEPVKEDGVLATLGAAQGTLLSRGEVVSGVFERAGGRSGLRRGGVGLRRHLLGWR